MGREAQHDPFIPVDALTAMASAISGGSATDTDEGDRGT